MFVQENPDAAQQIEIERAIITPPPGAAHWPDLTEHFFPVAQHVLRHVQLVSGFGNSAEGFGRFRHLYAP